MFLLMTAAVETVFSTSPAFTVIDITTFFTGATAGVLVKVISVTFSQSR